jgi:hypothetical protein
MTKILGLDPGTLNSLAWLYDPGTASADVTTVDNPAQVDKLPAAEPAPPKRLSLSTGERLHQELTQRRNLMSTGLGRIATGTLRGGESVG